ncbi:hypothetical protein GCM10010517_61530 [Streptosporangium fragile]|uniref:Uncharacterized protein n=1 Tax=Streptosporangium fragile TaxID=46186 RepID=A0ABP6ILJ7_9ACTN
MPTTSPDDMQGKLRGSHSENMLSWERFRKRRRIRRAAVALAPVLLLYVLAMAPAWIHDRHLSGLADRFLSHPLPPETEFSDDEVQASVALRGNSNHCDYRLRFNLQTKLSVDEVVRHYEAAKIGIEGGGVSVVVWTPSETPPFPLSFDDKLIIVEVQDNLHDPSWDLRCH